MTEKRVAALDLLKWVALITMVIDHGVYLAPDALNMLHVPGRVAFPLFCLVLATHVFRQQPGQLADSSNWAWIKKLVLYGVIAQPVFTLYIGAPTGDILFTLALGLALALAYHHRSTHKAAHVLFICVLIFSWQWRDFISYGLCGVLLPVAFVYALTQRTVETWMAPAILAFAANFPEAAQLNDLIITPVATFQADNQLTVVGAVVAAVTCVIGLVVCKQRIPFKVPAVTGWAYGFYPAHLLFLALVSLI